MSEQKPKKAAPDRGARREKELRRLAIVQLGVLFCCCALGILLLSDTAALAVSAIAAALLALFWLTGFDRRRSGVAQASPEVLDEDAQTGPEVLDEDAQMHILKRQAEVIALQSQINPHFLYNTLDSIRGQVLTEGLYETANMLEALSNLFRYSISKKNIIITLEEELENVDDYMRIINYRFPNRFLLEKDIDACDNRLMSFLLPKLTLQPLVENAIQHGLEKKKGVGRIMLRAFRTDEFVYFSVRDDGIGIDLACLDRLNAKLSRRGTDLTNDSGHHSGIALPNVASRLELLYGETSNVSVSSVINNGTEVNICVPFKKVQGYE
ncbi:MAG: sensor histidine kinase [Clostridiales bacterium]|nr:sensor histidine kinase [Clostridiales bacterium]